MNTWLAVDVHSLAYSEMRNLPNLSAVYAILAGEQTLYIGSTWLLRNRIAGHHNRDLFEQNGATEIRWIEVNDPYDLAVEEMKAIADEKPLLNKLPKCHSRKEWKSRKHDAKPNIPRSRLLDRTIELLKNRPASLILSKIEEDTGLPQFWLASLISKPKLDPSINRIVVLYEYLSGSKIEFR